MQCNAMQCNAMQCNAMQCNAMQCNAMQCNAMLCKEIQCNAMQYNAMQCNAVQCNAMHCNRFNIMSFQGKQQRRESIKMVVMVMVNQLHSVYCVESLKRRNQMIICRRSQVYLSLRRHPECNI